MKNKYTKIKFTAAAILLAGAAAAQVAVPSTFEDLTLAPGSYNDGASGSGNFTSGGATFVNSYNTGFGYWEGGFAYSNMGDTATGPSDFMTQLYETKAGTGHAGSSNFAIGTLNAGVKLDTPAVYATGIWLTNTAYAYNSMALGDGFGKKFGDTSATVHSAAGVNEGYPDWFLLDIVGYSGGVATDTVHFYLADFRFTDNSMDYIVRDWQFADLTPLGAADSLGFVLSSSDNGSFGMNTPAYFCIDDLAQGVVTGIGEAIRPDLGIYPNPFADAFTIDMKTAAPRIVTVYNAFGQAVLSLETDDAKIRLSLDAAAAGIYFVNVQQEGSSFTKRIVKK